MSSRMDKYSIEKPELKSRTEINADLYQSSEIENYNKIDINSNVSILKEDARSIDVNLIKEMLDNRYREDAPKRKSIDINIEKDEIYKEKINTKEYDINEILAKAKHDQNVDYNIERLKKLRNTNYEILQNLDLELKNAQEKNERSDSENELMSLINTITKLELENQEKVKKDAGDLLDLNDTIIDIPTKQEALENSFYTGNLSVKDNDFEDFKEIQNDIKSNSTLIKILVVIFILILVITTLFLLNKHLNWDLF